MKFKEAFLLSTALFLTQPVLGSGPVDPLEDLIAVDDVGNDGDDTVTFYIPNNGTNITAGVTQAFVQAAGYPGYYWAYDVDTNGSILGVDGTTHIGQITFGSPNVDKELIFISGNNTLNSGIYNKPVTTNTDAKINISGDCTFNEGLTSNGGTITIEPNAKITIPTGKALELKSGTKLNFNKTELIVDGDITTKESFISFLGNNNINGSGQFILDPSTFDNRGTTTVNIPITLGNATDSWNVLKADVGSLLTVNNTMTLNNKNVLVVGYKASSITAQALTDILIANMTAGTNSNGTFDYVLTLGLNDDGSSTGILQPIDATVTNNQGTFLFNVTQSSTGAKLEIKGAEPDAGSNIDSIIQELVNTNTAFANFLGYNSTASSYSYRLNNVTNALIGANELAKSSLGIPTDQVGADFRFTPVILTKNMSPEKKLETLFEALSQNGAMERSNNEYRVWVSPFSQQANEGGPSANRGWLLGSLVGAEYRNLSNQYTIGLLGGMNFGSQRSKIQTLNGSNIRGVNVGAYGSYGAWEGGRLDALYVRSLNWLKESRRTNTAIALNDHKATVDIVDLQTSHLIKIPGDIWSVRFNLGHTYSYTDSEGYTEYNAPLNERRAVSGSIGKSYEVYGGIGVRYNARGNEWRTRITGLYEYGKEYKVSASRVRTSHGRNLNIHTFSTDNNEKAKTHYATLYTSINNSTGWKFIMGYQGAFKKNSVGTSIYAKAEYRF